MSVVVIGREKTSGVRSSKGHCDQVIFLIIPDQFESDVFASVTLCPKQGKFSSLVLCGD